MGDGWALTGVVPSSPAGVATGGVYRLAGGALFGGEGEAPTEQPVIRARLTADHLAELSWDEGLTGLVLEVSSELGAGAVWQPADPQPSGNVFLAPIDQPARYFRLRRP